MKRDMDLVRDLLLRLEEIDMSPYSPEVISSGEDLKFDDYTPDQVDYHMGLLYEAGLVISGTDTDMMMDGQWIYRRLTWAGHDFADSVRDPEVWRRTREGASKMGGWTFDLLKEMGKAYLKHVAKERLGLDL